MISLTKKIVNSSYDSDDDVGGLDFCEVRWRACVFIVGGWGEDDRCFRFVAIDDGDIDDDNVGCRTGDLWNQ